MLRFLRGLFERSAPPERFKIAHNDYHAKYIGIAADGRQFFLSNLFEWAHDQTPGREFVALFLFDRDGNLVADRVEELGSREKLGVSPALPGNKAESNVIDRVLQKELNELGNVEFCDIDIKPFEIERLGLSFGFIPRAPDDKDDHWWVELHPGNFMAFYPPWDGTYDT